MAFNFQAGPSSSSQHQPGSSMYGSSGESTSRPNGQFDILAWYPHFQSCHRYFLDHAQHSGPVQALAAFLNIQLPFQKQPFPVRSSSSASSPHAGGGPDLRTHLPQPNLFSNPNAGHPQAVSLTPYIRRLVATGHDAPGVLHGFFGDDWVEGVGSLHEVERRNYLFAAKSTNWLKVKQAYDMSPDEVVPFLRPLREASEEELHQADLTWSEWLAMQDWMLGPRAPGTMHQSPRVKRESQDS